MLISVVITTKNEESNIENCLKSVLAQTYPQDMIETIVVDNNSTDRTVELVKGFTPLNLKVFNWGPERSAQRNYGVEKSSGEYFLYLDADMTLSENVIKDCVNKVDKNPEIIALHISEIVMGERFFSKVRRFERSFYDGTVIDGVRFIKKNEFQKVGGFDEKLTGPEDWDLDKKLKKVYPVVHGGTGVGKLDLVKTPIYHNEAEFDLKKYLSKKGYYAQKFDDYIAKWGKDDEDIKKQFGIYYRFIGVFVEKGRFTPSSKMTWGPAPSSPMMTWGWKKLLAHPILTVGMFTLRILVGIKFLMRKSKIRRY